MHFIWCPYNFFIFLAVFKRDKYCCATVVFSLYSQADKEKTVARPSQMGRSGPNTGTQAGLDPMLKPRRGLTLYSSPGPKGAARSMPGPCTGLAQYFKNLIFLQ